MTFFKKHNITSSIIINDVFNKIKNKYLPLPKEIIDSEKFRQSILCLKDKLESLNLKTYYHFQKPTNAPSSIYRQSPTILKKEFAELSSSKAILLICPFSELFSSCWIEIGAAIMLDIPIIIACINRNHLPFIIRERSRSIGNIQIIELEDTTLPIDINKFVQTEIYERIKVSFIGEGKIL